MNLKDALEKLEAFTRQQEGRTFPHLLAPESSLLQKTVKLLQIALSDRIKTEHLREAEQVKQDIEYAVRVVKSHHVLLENYKTGSPEQQALAKRASGLFHRFNALVERTAHPQENWKTHIAHLYCKVSGVCIGLELNKIELPPTALIASRLPKLAAARGTLHTHRITRHPNPNQSEAKIDAVFHQEGFPHPLSRREADAFRGKMFSLLKEHKITFASPAEEVFMVQQAPLQFIQNDDLVTVKTNLYPFPGEEVKIEGVFQRQPEALAPSVPLIDRFSLKYQNIQTGFPYPAQLHGGVTWADQLLPSLPHHPQEIPLIVQLLEQKQKIALQLHENRDFLREAKTGLATKRKRALADLDTYLQLEKRLSIALASASSEEIDIGAIDAFFSNLHQHSAPFDYLACICEYACMYVCVYVCMCVCR